MKTSLPPKANLKRLGHAKYGDTLKLEAVKLQLGDAVWVNPLIAPGALANFNGFATDAEFTISANRSISNSGLKKLFFALAFACVVVAGFSYMQGNVWVPMFVLLDLAIVCAAIFAVARASRASDTIIVNSDDKRLLVRTCRRQLTSQRTFNLLWARLETTGPTHAPRIYLTASGSWVEIGSFLNHEQRVSLANQLKGFLELAKARALN